jgi:hypothetical protein
VGEVEQLVSVGLGSMLSYAMDIHSAKQTKKAVLLQLQSMNVNDSDLQVDGVKNIAANVVTRDIVGLTLNSLLVSIGIYVKELVIGGPILEKDINFNSEVKSHESLTKLQEETARQILLNVPKPKECALEVDAQKETNIRSDSSDSFKNM